MKIHFLKCHGSGNDFVLIDETELSFSLNKDVHQDLSIKLSDRKGIIGSDGVIYLNKSTNDQSNAKMVVYTPNGMRIPMCVNGLRCAGRYLFEKTPELSIVSIETDVGNINVKKDNKFLGIDRYLIDSIKPILTDDINPPIFTKANSLINDFITELSPTLKFTIISVHTPHAVCIVDFIDESELSYIGNKANSLPDLFPNGINISFVKKIDDSSIYVRTYERNNIGLSLSCASAMIASSYTLCLLGSLEFNKSIFVYNKGGLVSCICYATSAVLSGNATFVYTGDFDYNLDTHLISNTINGTLFLKEMEAYSGFLITTKQMSRENDILI